MTQFAPNTYCSEGHYDGFLTKTTLKRSIYIAKDMLRPAQKTEHETGKSFNPAPSYKDWVQDREIP
jgi:hypothetical protein